MESDKSDILDIKYKTEKGIKAINLIKTIPNLVKKYFILFLTACLFSIYFAIIMLLKCLFDFQNLHLKNKSIFLRP